MLRTELGMPVTLDINHHPCIGANQSDVPLVLLHGWGNDSGVWHPLLPFLCQHLDVITLDLPGFGSSSPAESWPQAVDHLARRLPEKFFLLGWSLGGMLAVQLADKYPERVVKLVTLASNASFVCRSGWKTAMPITTFDDFYQGFIADPQGSIKQFAVLESLGDSHERTLLRWLRANAAAVTPLAWLHALDWLKQLDNREALARLKLPSLHLFGQNDQLVPALAAKKLASLSRKSRVQVVDGVGHAPHLSQPEKIAQLALNFLVAKGAVDVGSPEQHDPYLLRKQQIADSFGRAAASYDAVAQLQREVGEALLQQLPADIQPSAIADMGCGTGYFTARLAALYPESSCTGIDLAPGMLSYAASHHQNLTSVSWLCGDAEATPVADGRFDLIFSNFTFQWCQDLPALMAEQWRLLKPGGLLLFTTVGPNSLWQLRDAWQQVDDYVHVNQFLPLEDVRTALQAQHFQLHHWREQSLVRHYDQLNGLTRELKALGAHNLNQGRNGGLTGRKHIDALKAAYETFRGDDGLPATWEILYVVAQKPHGVGP